MGKIASTDSTAMNHLFSVEASRQGIHLAAGEDPQAFKDHEEYLSVVDSVLKADKSNAWDPNSVTLD
jgi:hypothetical protein